MSRPGSRSIRYRRLRKLDLVTYLNLESARDGTYDNRKIRDGITFLSDFNPNYLSEVEIEMCLMHVAFIIDSKNCFKDNYNVVNKKAYIDHIAMVKDCDCSAWCKKLYDLSLWQHGNRVVVNLTYNWLSSSFKSFERIIP
jgi:hypothetical protein